MDPVRGRASAGGVPVVRFGRGPACGRSGRAVRGASGCDDKLESIRTWIGRFFENSGSGGSSSDGVSSRVEYLGTILLAAVLAAFFVFLLVLWVRSEPFDGRDRARRGRVPGTGPASGAASRETGVSGSTIRGRKHSGGGCAGDFAGAVIYLFAHQLFSLDRAGLIRLAPGWTGRQYVRWLRDPVLVDSLRGDSAPVRGDLLRPQAAFAQAFEQVWGRGQALEDAAR